MMPLLQRELTVKPVPGTDWLSALQAAGNQSDLDRVYLFSDLVQQAEGIDLAQQKSTSLIERYAREWAPRLRRLSGKLVVSVGGGQKLSGSRPDTQGVQLFEDLARLVHFRGEVLSTL
jgi:hypothetical protein